MASRSRSDGLRRMADAQALLLKLEKLRLVELERRAEELAELERAVLSEAATSDSGAKLVSSYKGRLRTISREQHQTTEDMKRQSALVLKYGSVEKIARNLLKDAEADEQRALERAELEQIVEAVLGKTSLP